MSQQLAERGQAFELPEPAPSNYHPNYTLAEQLQYDARAQGQLTDEQTAALMPSSFTRIVDNGWDRWFMLVLPGDRPDALTLQLQVTDIITWWKKIEVSGCRRAEVKQEFNGDRENLDEQEKYQDSQARGFEAGTVRAGLGQRLQLRE